MGAEDRPRGGRMIRVYDRVRRWALAVPGVCWWIVLVVYCVSLYLQSSKPSVDGPDWFEIPHSDKLLHAAAYAVWATIATLALRTSTRLSGRAVLVAAAAAATLYGATDEFHQSFVPERDADVWDLVADGAGAVAAAVFWGAIETLRRRIPGDSSPDFGE